MYSITYCVYSVGMCGIDENFGYRFSKNRTEPNRPQNSKTENSVSAVRFTKNRLRRFGDGFSRCPIHNSSCSMIGSTVNIFFFVPCLCTSSSESLRLTISWTNSSRKHVISSVTQIKQHTVQKLNQKLKPQLI